MKISAKIDYACRALLALSLHWPNSTPLRIHVIASQQKIPVKFLTQILIVLKQLGYVKSVRGKSGGYLLAQPPQDILLSQLVKQMSTHGANGGVSDIKESKKHVMSFIWEEIDTVLIEAMQAFTFESIAQRQRQQDNVVTFDI